MFCTRKKKLPVTITVQSDSQVVFFFASLIRVESCRHVSVGCRFLYFIFYTSYSQYLRTPFLLSPRWKKMKLTLKEMSELMAPRHTFVWQSADGQLILSLMKTTSADTHLFFFKDLDGFERGQMERSVSVSVGVVFGLTLPPLSSGMEDESPLRPGSTPGTKTHTDTEVTSQVGRVKIQVIFLGLLFVLVTLFFLI